MDKKYFEYIFVVFIALLLSIMCLRDFIFSEGHIILAEQIEVYTLDNFKNIFLYTWSDRLQVGIPDNIDVSKIYLYSLLLFLPNFLNSFKLLEILIWGIPTFLSFISMYFLAKYIFSNRINDKFILFVICLILAFLYVFNPWQVLHPRNIFERIPFAVFPLLMLFFLRILRENKFLYIFLFAFLLSIISGYRSMAIFFPVFMIFTFFFILFNRSKFFSILPKFILVLILILLLLFGRFFVPIYFFITTNSQSSINTFTQTQFFKEDVINLFSLSSVKTISNFEYVYTNNHYYLYFFVVLFSLFYLLFLKKIDFELIVFPVIFLIYFLFSCSNLNVISLLTNFDMPLNNIIGRLFRHPGINIMPMVSSVIIMCGFSLYFIYKKFNSKCIILTVAVLLFTIALFSSWPLITGNLNGYYNPTIIPKDYLSTNELLFNDSNYFHTIWMPSFSDRRAVWSSATGQSIITAPTGIFGIRSSSKPSYWIYNYPFFKYYNPIGTHPYRRPVGGYEGEKLFIPYSHLNVKYVILKSDILWTPLEVSWGFSNEHLKEKAKKFSSQNGVSEVYFGEYLSVFNVNNTDPFIYIKPPILFVGSINDYTSLFEIENEKNGVVLFNDKYNSNEVLFSSIFLFNKPKPLSELIPYYFPNEVYIIPSNYVDRNITPNLKWSYFSSISSYSFQSQLKKFGLDDCGWDFDYNYKLVATSKNNSMMALPVNIDHLDTYNIRIRYLQNQKGGIIKIYVDGQPKEIITKDQINNFVWIDLGKYNLTKGQHEIILENVYGFNAVNVFSVMPNENVLFIESQVNEYLQNKTLIYLFEGESDMYYENATIVHNSTLSNSKALTFSKNGKLWQKFEVLNEGYYKIGLKFIGDTDLIIDNYNINLKSDGSSLIYTEPFYLIKGIHTFRILQYQNSEINETLVDVLWIYSVDSVDSNETLETVFGTLKTHSNVLNYSKVDPTLWNTKIYADKPFFLTFAEGYDPLWEARVYKNGQMVETVSSVPVYGTINGFWINETGDLDIEIRYKPQDWFEYGLVISATTFILCVVYLFYSWRLEKEDKWAKKINSKFPKLF